MSEDLYCKLCELGRSHKILYHYTDIGGIKAILENNSLRLTRLDKVNDPCENNRIDELWSKKVYVGCFTHTLDNEDYFYNEYNHIRLTVSIEQYAPSVFFDSKCKNKLETIKRGDFKYKEYDKVEDWGIYDVSFADIEYVENISLSTTKNGRPICPGLIKESQGKDEDGKSRNWEQEKETRLRVTLKPKGPEFELKKETNSFLYPKPPEKLEYLYVPVPGTILQADIYFGAENETKADFYKVCAEYKINNKE